MSQTTVSLPPHLRANLSSLTKLLSDDLKSRLLSTFDKNASEISHKTLLDISRWARTELAQSQLKAASLDPNDYTMIAMLAGTITSPSSKFPPYVPPPDSASQAKKAVEDRRAIVALLNALLSIGCVGYSAWWASKRTGWQDEWRVLFALFAAFVVAIAEAGLYIVWQAKKDEALRRRWARRMGIVEKKKEEREEPKETEAVASAVDESQSLRRRPPQIAGQEKKTAE
ncbi:hypothetical protein M422DRAFT_57860 [Sphaerobolus stellatus SS14]|nr:hypothetical protein M422DRAFT_57860 [Sphaerobolus stellatus SS14]